MGLDRGEVPWLGVMGQVAAVTIAVIVLVSMNLTGVVAPDRHAGLVPESAP